MASPSSRPNEPKYVGTAEELVHACSDASWGDTGDLFGIVRDDVIAKLKEANLIVTSEVTNA